MLRLAPHHAPEADARRESMIEAIVRWNPTASRRFLQGFDTATLSAYLARLEAVMCSGGGDDEVHRLATAA